jgi:hypothetical protein
MLDIFCIKLSVHLKYVYMKIGHFQIFFTILIKEKEQYFLQHFRKKSSSSTRVTINRYVQTTIYLLFVSTDKINEAIQDIRINELD